MVRAQPRSFTSRGWARFHLRQRFLSQCEQQLTLSRTVSRSIVLIFVCCLFDVVVLRALRC
jgi:hypothetical protein